MRILSCCIFFVFTRFCNATPDVPEQALDLPQNFDIEDEEYVSYDAKPESEIIQYLRSKSNDVADQDLRKLVDFIKKNAELSEQFHQKMLRGNHQTEQLNQSRLTANYVMNIFLTCIVFPMLAAFYFSLLWEEILRALAARNSLREDRSMRDEEAMNKRMEVVQEMTSKVAQVTDCSDVNDLCKMIYFETPLLFFFKRCDMLGLHKHW